MRRTLSLVLLTLALCACEGGGEHDARVAADKQAKIEACSAAGKYPSLDPNYPLVVYCSNTPICAPIR